MPELPEVETVARGLQASLEGRRVVSVRLGKTDFIEDPVALAERVTGSRITEVRRHGKFLLLQLEPAEIPAGSFFLVIHLGMTGQLTARMPEDPVARHTHAFFQLDDGRELRYTDIRRFGRIAVVPDSHLAQFLQPLGLDPLEATEEDFHRLLGGRRARIKALLLDQHVLRGMGNIYTDESLWRARIHPARLGTNLKLREVTRLGRAIRRVLREAIRLRGSSVSDYVDAEGLPGGYQRRHRVYGREGKGCSRCGGKIRRVIVAGRSSYFCPHCQRGPQLASPGTKRDRGARRRATKPEPRTPAGSSSGASKFSTASSIPI